MMLFWWAAAEFRHWFFPWWATREAVLLALFWRQALRGEL